MSILTKQQAESRILETLPNDIKKLSDFFTYNDKKIFLVGGCLRDTFLGKLPKDYDVCTDAKPGEVIDILKRYDVQYNVQGEHFGVIVAKMDDGEYEIASFRIDKNDTADRNTNVILDGVTMEDDVKRRDFTINALFMDLQDRCIIDLVGGIDDLSSGTVRCVGNPVERFKEDSLRKLRAIRFSTRLGFVIDDATFKAIYDNPDLNISGERIVNELTTIYSTSKDTSELIYLLYDTRLVHQIFRGLIINDKADIKTSNICSFNTLLASIICSCNIDVATKLVNMNFTAKTAESVQFLLNGIEVPIEQIKPMYFFNKRKSTNLTDAEISIYNNETDVIKWLIEFVPDSTLSETLMAQGYKGKDLGEKINDTYQNAFISAINRMRKQTSEF